MARRGCTVCGAITDKTRCPKHPKQPSPSSREAQTPQYRAIRRRIQAERPPCHWCGKPATTPDHLTPVSKGGTSEPSNIVPACASCNYSRGNRYN